MTSWGPFSCKIGFLLVSVLQDDIMCFLLVCVSRWYIVQCIPKLLSYCFCCICWQLGKQVRLATPLWCKALQTSEQKWNIDGTRRLHADKIIYNKQSIILLTTAHRLIDLFSVCDICIQTYLSISLYTLSSIDLPAILFTVC